MKTKLKNVLWEVDLELNEDLMNRFDGDIGEFCDTIQGGSYSNTLVGILKTVDEQFSDSVDQFIEGWIDQLLETSLEFDSSEFTEKYINDIK